MAAKLTLGGGIGLVTGVGIAFVSKSQCLINYLYRQPVALENNAH